VPGKRDRETRGPTEGGNETATGRPRPVHDLEPCKREVLLWECVASRGPTTPPEGRNVNDDGADSPGARRGAVT